MIDDNAKKKIAEVMGDVIRHRLKDGYEEDMKRRAERMAFIDKIIEFGKQLKDSESK